MKFCCDEFAKNAGALQATVGGGWIYPRNMRPLAQFEPDRDGQTWNINGCCGGSCWVVSEMRFCPYCGNSMAANAEAMRK